MILRFCDFTLICFRKELRQNTEPGQLTRYYPSYWPSLKWLKKKEIIYHFWIGKFEFQDTGSLNRPCMNRFSSLERVRYSFFQWTSVRRGNRRIITCLAVHFHAKKKKRRQLFYSGKITRVIGKWRDWFSGAWFCSNWWVRLPRVVFSPAFPVFRLSRIRSPCPGLPSLWCGLSAVLQARPQGQGVCAGLAPILLRRACYCFVWSLDGEERGGYTPSPGCFWCCYYCTRSTCYCSCFWCYCYYGALFCWYYWAFFTPSKRIITLLLTLIQHEKIPWEELS